MKRYAYRDCDAGRVPLEIETLGITRLLDLVTCIW
jgi:hypothetical protein